MGKAFLFFHEAIGKPCKEVTRLVLLESDSNHSVKSFTNLGSVSSPVAYYILFLSLSFLICDVALVILALKGNQEN